MKNLISIAICLLVFQTTDAQNILLKKVNSANVLDYYQQIQSGSYQKSSIDIIKQIGNGNIYQMADKSPKYLEVIQNGNFNTTYFINPNNYPSNAQVHINGSGNYIDITGSNSISNGMQININANDMRIFVRNY